MGFFNKLKNVAKSAANVVEDVASEIENAASEVGHVVVKGAKEIQDFGEDSFEAMKNKAEEIKDDTFDLEEKFTGKLMAFLEDNEAAIKRVGHKVEALVKENVSPPYEEVSQMIKDLTSSNEADVAMKTLARGFQVQDMNEDVDSIGPFETWSFQLGAEANFIAGISSNIGYATPIFSSSANKTAFILSGDIDVGPQFGIGGGLAWGWWTAAPEDLSGISYCVGISVAYYAGLGITGYWDPISGYFQGFTLEFILAGVGVEAAAGFSFTSTGSNYEAIIEAI